MFRFLTSWRISCYTILCKFSFGWSLYVILFSFNWPIPSREQENERKAKTKWDVIYLPKWFLSSSLKRTCWLKFFTLHPAVSCWFSWFIRRLFSGASPNFSSTLNFVYVSVSVSTSANYHMTTTAPSYLIFADQLMLNTLNVLLVAAEISTKKATPTLNLICAVQSIFCACKYKKAQQHEKKEARKKKLSSI